jgi:DNA-binding transcriptional LysR family regulator
MEAIYSRYSRTAKRFTMVNLDGIIPTIMPKHFYLFLNNFIKKYPKVYQSKSSIMDEIIKKLNNGHLDAAIAATPLLEEKKLRDSILNLLLPIFLKTIILFKKRKLNGP